MKRKLVTKSLDRDASPLADGLTDSITTALVSFKEMPKPQKAEAARKAIVQIADAGGKLEVLAGELLYMIREGELWRLFKRSPGPGEPVPVEAPTFDSFDDYVEAECPFKRRTAFYLMAIYEKFVIELGLAPDVLRSIEWSKAKEILAVVTKANCASLLKMLPTMTVREVAEMVQDMMAKGSSKTVTDDPVRKEVPTPDDPEELGSMKTLRVRLFPAQLENIENAMKVAGWEVASEKPGHLLDVICTDFLVSRAGEHKEGGEAERLEALCGRLDQQIQRLERVFKVKLEIVGSAAATEDTEAEDA